MDAIFWILKTGAQWSSIPRTVAPHTTIHGKFKKWVKAGVFDKIMEKAKTLYQERNSGWDVWFALDAALVKAPLGGEKTGKNPTDRGKLGSKKSMIVDQKGARFVWLIRAILIIKPMTRVNLIFIVYSFSLCIISYQSISKNLKSFFIVEIDVNKITKRRIG